MEITNDALDWTSEDIDLWSQFLRTQTGSRLIPKMLEACPQLLENGDTNAILIRSGIVQGMGNAARAILSLALHPQKEQKSVSDYPALEDDAAWPDGRKLTDNPTTIE